MFFSLYKFKSEGIRNDQDESNNNFKLIDNDFNTNNNIDNNKFESENKNTNILEKRINSSKNRLYREDDLIKSNNLLQTSQIISVSRLAKTPDKNQRRFRGQNLDLIADTEIITIKKNEISFNNYSKQDFLNNSNNKIIKINSLNSNSNKSKQFSNKEKNFEIMGTEQCAIKSLKSNDIRSNKSISVSNYNMDESYKEVSKDDENSFQLNDNDRLRMNNLLFEEGKNNNNFSNSGNQSLKNEKKSVF